MKSWVLLVSLLLVLAAAVASPVALAQTEQCETVVFESIRDKGTGIYRMNSSGTGMRQITHTSPDGGLHLRPALSPDGTQIAFVRLDDAYDIYTVGIDGNNQIRLTHGEGTGYVINHVPDWSPSGDQIVFTSVREDKDREIFVMNADGTGQVQITDNELEEYSPDWSPDGSKIAFGSRDSQGRYIINTMNPDGTARTRVLVGEHGFAHAVDWSPDGSRLAFSTGYHIYLVNLDGTDLRQLTRKSSALDSGPAWSLDGTRIFFTRDAQEHDDGYPGAQIYVVPVDGGSEPVQLTSEARGHGRVNASPSVGVCAR